MMNGEPNFFITMVGVCAIVSIWLVVLTILIEQHMSNLRLDIARMHDEWLSGFVQEERDYADDLLKEFLEEDAP